MVQTSAAKRGPQKVEKLRLLTQNPRPARFRQVSRERSLVQVKTGIPARVEHCSAETESIFLHRQTNVLP